MGAYSRWALIRGWALIRINTVSAKGLTTRATRELPRERLTFHFYWVLCFALHVGLVYSFLVTQSKRSAGTLKLFKTCEPP